MTLAETTSSSSIPPFHPSLATGHIGVLLINLGTPDGTDYWSIRRYLKEFLWDRRVIESPRIFWWPVLHGIVLATRPGRKGRDYKTIWNKDRNESPLKTVARAQAEKISQRLTKLHPNIIVEWAMRYGNPGIRKVIEAMCARGCNRILLFPLYPQYAAATSATACDEAFRTLMGFRWQPAIRVAPPYYDDAVYIDALAEIIRSELDGLTFEPEVILASFHGLPKSCLLKGDPYYCHCQKTARLLRERLGLSGERFKISFQSRFGASEWLQPYTDVTVRDLAHKGVKGLAVVTPGFSVDCLETLEEISRENAEVFFIAGGKHFAAIPCLNDSSPGLRLIEHLATRELQGWI